jgi:hypothetical protein
VRNKNSENCEEKKKNEKNLEVKLCEEVNGVICYSLLREKHIRAGLSLL